MNVLDYLSEDGPAAPVGWHVRDLVVEGGSGPELVMVFESPHVAELAAGLPVVGASGRDALRFLRDDRKLDLRLGAFVDERHCAGDGRVAILNVSNVPLQAAALGSCKGPDLTETDWVVLERVRRAGPARPRTFRSADARDVADLRVPHPSYGQWNRVGAAGSGDLEALRESFAHATA